MKEFIMILIFANAITLTSVPIDINDQISFDLAEPISAITSGAHIRIDVKNNLEGKAELSNVVSILDALRAQFPEGSVTAILSTRSGEKFILDKVSGSTDGEDAEILLSSSKGVPTKVEFFRVEIRSSRKLTGVTITWQNYAK